jgi:predicted dehydrogenase
MGVLGLGRMGQFHCRMISDCEWLQLVAGSSGYRELRKAVAGKFALSTYDDHRKLLKDPQVEWIMIAATPDHHGRWAHAAIGKGKKIIV